MAGEPRFLERVEDYYDRYPDLAAATADSDTRAIAALPLAVDHRVIGGLGLSFLEPHPFDEDERAFLLALAQQCAQALERSRLHEEVRGLNRDLERAALTDPLTGLGNRRALAADFERFSALARRRVEPLLLSLWDVDGLKRINDSLGHAAGDAHLLAFVRR
jgi:GAF domain-containing protein